ncbi:MAG: hypothetical protein N2234_00195 [Planctomycetota bacterium]|nr:hypothetical protein [Planctomycetota bacterium]
MMFCVYRKRFKRRKVGKREIRMDENLQKSVEKFMLQGVWDCDDICEIIGKEGVAKAGVKGITLKDEVVKAREEIIQKWLKRVREREKMAAELAVRLSYIERRLWGLFGASETASERVGLLKGILGIIEQFIRLIGLDKVEWEPKEGEKEYWQAVSQFLRRCEEKEEDVESAE